jgi:hypothetical protein
MKLDGRGAFSDGELWTEVILEVRNDEIVGLRWGSHNAILAAPGETMTSLGEVVAFLNEEYQGVGGLTFYWLSCVKNDTSTTIEYRFRWGTGSWSYHSLESGQHSWHSNLYERVFDVEFDSSFTSGHEAKLYRLETKLSSRQSCDAATRYTFVTDGRTLDLTLQK